MSKHTLMFGWEYPPKHLGGLGVACQGLVQGLLKLGTKITLVLPHGDGEEEHDNVEIVSPTEELRKTVKVRSALQPYDTPESYALRNESEYLRSDLPLYADDLGAAVYEYTELAVDMTKHADPDVVHSHDWMTFGAGTRAAAFHHVPFVAQVHATELDRTHGSPNQWIYDQERKGLSKADHIITVSDFTKQMLVREYGISGDKIDVVHNGAPHSQCFDPAIHQPTSQLHSGGDADPMVLFLGRLTIQKGPFHFLEAALRVHRVDPDVRFVVAGEGYLLSELVDRSVQMGLQDNMIFAGKVSSDEAKQLYSQSSCFVMPSTSEPFGLVALEAIAHGAPVIVSKQSGAAEVVQHSFQIDFWDVDKLADCILTVLREQPLAHHMRSQAVHTLHHLTWENQAGKVLSIYDKVRCNW